jgi:hypothetical protein
VTPPDLHARSRVLLAAWGLGAMAMAALAMIWMTLRRPIASIRRRQRKLPVDPPEPADPDARRGALLTAFGLGAIALAAVAVMLVVGLSGYRAPEPRINAYRAPEPAVSESRAAGRASSAGRHERPKPSESLPRSIPRRLFARTSVWNRRIQAATPVDPASSTLIAALHLEVDRELQAGTGPSIATDQGSTPLYRVKAGHRRVRVRLDAEQAPALRRAFAAVPIPDGAEPAGGPDRHMAIWQPSTDRLWELSGARRRADGWHAGWGGAFRDVSRSRGYYDSAAWPGATRYWGATGSGLPVTGGMIMADDLQRRRIDHALAISLPAPRAGPFAWPAQRTDGTGPLAALPEGARLRLDPQLDLRTLELPRLVRMIARAAQHHGLVIRGRTDRISLFAEDPAPLGRNPYRRYFLGRTPQELLAYFPWDRLQVLEMHLCWTAPCRQG